MAVNCTLKPPPEASKYLANLDTTWLVLIIVAACVTFIVIAIYIEEVLFIMRNLRKWKMRNKVLYLLGLYPVFALTSTMGLLVPRSEDLDDLASSLYLSVALYIFVKMLIGHYGGKRRMCSTLSYLTISTRTPPLCCCCCCLPDVQVSTSNIRVLEGMVLQYAVLKPIILYVSMLLLLNDRTLVRTTSAQSNITATFNTTSMFIALWGNVMLFKLSAEPLKHLSIKPKFFALQLVLLTENLQKTVLGWFATGGILTCTDQLDITSATLRMNGLMKVFEMLLISLLARRHYRKDQQEWFKFENDDLDNSERVDPAVLDDESEMSRSSSHTSSNYGTIVEKP